MKTPPSNNDQVQVQPVVLANGSPQFPLGSAGTFSQVHVPTNASQSCVDLESNQCYLETVAIKPCDHPDERSSHGKDSVHRKVAVETAMTRRLMDICAASILVVLVLGGICGTGHCNVGDW
jgi:hypothetical protein